MLKLIRKLIYYETTKILRKLRKFSQKILCGILVGLVTTVIQAITAYFGVTNGIGLAQLQASGVTVMVAFAVGMIVQLIISGFVIEYINNTRNALVKWVQR